MKLLLIVMTAFLLTGCGLDIFSPSHTPEPQITTAAEPTPASSIKQHHRHHRRMHKNSQKIHKSVDQSTAVPIENLAR